MPFPNKKPGSKRNQVFCWRLCVLKSNDGCKGGYNSQSQEENPDILLFARFDISGAEKGQRKNDVVKCFDNTRRQRL